MVLTLDLPAVPAASNIRGLDCGINLVHPHRLCPTNFHVLYCPKLVRDSCVGYMRVRRRMGMCIYWLNLNQGLRVQRLMYAEQYEVAIHPRADIGVCRSLAQSCVKQSTVVLATIEIACCMSASLFFDQDRVLFPKIRRPSYLGFPEKSRAWYLCISF